MLPNDDGGWETVANVQFQSIHNHIQPTEDDAVPPPPEFTASPVASEDVLAEIPPQTADDIIEVTDALADNAKPSSQYVFGTSDNSSQLNKPTAIRVIETLSKKSAHENVIEAEIRQQQLREECLREEAARRTRDKTGGASSPSSHASDEGFVDRTPEELSTPPTSVSPAPSSPQIFEAAYGDKMAPTSSETKIAMEIRELREREAELRAMREIRGKKQITDDFADVEQTSTSSQSEDPMTSIITTTDEGNFSEYGDSASTEDKSSDGFNSRIMSPDLQPYPEHRQRRVTVKPYEDDTTEEQTTPVYARMKKESVIEREIRLAKEREEAYRKEKGLIGQTVTQTQPAKSSGPKVTPVDKVAAVDVVEGKLGAQRISSSYIQQDIEATLQKERELRSGGQIKTLSEDTVDSKVTRMVDLSTDRRPGHPVKSFSTKVRSSKDFDSPPVATRKSGLSPSPSSPYVPNFTPSPATRPVNNKLTRSLSTNNLSTPFGTGAPMRAPRGLMQKFIASRGKVTAPTFVASAVGSSSSSTPEPIITRPMTVQPKNMVSRVDPISRTKPESNGLPKFYKRTHATAEEKIQSELKEMRRREDELRRLRARNFGRSQPNLTGIGLDDDEEDSYLEDDSSCILPEINGLKSALSNPNLLDDESDRSSPSVNQAEKTVRRRSALIAHWEGRIQQTADT